MIAVFDLLDDISTEMSTIGTFTRVISSFEPMVSPRPATESETAGNSVFSAMSICLASQCLGEHIVKPTSEKQEPADSEKQSQLITLSDEWEGEVVEEVFEEGILKFKVRWVPTLEPEENLSAEMRKAWEEKKARLVLKKQRGAGRIPSWSETSMRTSQELG
jgi:hypothetical protein